MPTRLSCPYSLAIRAADRGGLGRIVKSRKRLRAFMTFADAVFLLGLVVVAINIEEEVFVREALNRRQ